MISQDLCLGLIWGTIEVFSIAGREEIDQIWHSRPDCVFDCLSKTIILSSILLF